MEMSDNKHLVKSKQRVADHGEVFTPSWMVKDMLDLVKNESERIDARVLEPAAVKARFCKRFCDANSQPAKHDTEKTYSNETTMRC